MKKEKEKEQDLYYDNLFNELFDIFSPEELKKMDKFFYIDNAYDEFMKIQTQQHKWKDIT